MFEFRGLTVSELLEEEGRKIIKTGKLKQRTFVCVKPFGKRIEFVITFPSGTSVFVDDKYRLWFEGRTDIFFTRMGDRYLAWLYKPENKKSEIAGEVVFPLENELEKGKVIPDRKVIPPFPFTMLGWIPKE